MLAEEQAEIARKNADIYQTQKQVRNKRQAAMYAMDAGVHDFKMTGDKPTKKNDEAWVDKPKKDRSINLTRIYEW